MRRATLYLLLFTFTGTLPAICAAQNRNVTVVIQPVFNGQPVVLDGQKYVDDQNDTLTIDLFRFYITNLKLISPQGSFTDSNAHLIDAEQSHICRFEVKNVPTGEYSNLQFTLGVDSASNTNGANGGDLDPAKGMYWAWNTGYVMAKLEGISNACKTLHHAFEFHVGGYMPPYNAARSVKLSLPQETILAGATIVIKADVAAWFKGVNLAQTNSIVIPGREACQMADNYAQMFTISEVRKQ